MGDGVKLVDVRQISYGLVNQEHPVFSPDGKRLAWYAGPYGGIQIYVAAADGSAIRPLTCAKGNHTQAAWSSDGTHVYYRAQRETTDPWRIERAAVEDPEEKAVLLEDRKTSFKHPSPSPDGRWLAWFSDLGTPGNFHLWKAPLAARGLGKPIRLTEDPQRNDCHPTWSPDGTRLAFHAYMGVSEAATSHVFTCTADGTDLRQLTEGEAFHKHPFFVGSGLVVHHTETPDGNRFLALRRTADGSPAGDVTSGKHNDKHPSPYVPPRGPVKIAFSSKKRGLAIPGATERSYDVFVGTLTGVTVRR